MRKVLQSLTALCVVVALSGSASAFPVMTSAAGSGAGATGTAVVEDVVVPVANSASVLTVTGDGDLNGLEEGFTVTIEGNGNSWTSGLISGLGGAEGAPTTLLSAMFTLTGAQLDALFATGLADITFDGNDNVSGPTTYTATLAAVPEPTSMALLAIGGLVGGGAYRRRKAKNA